MPSCRNFPAGSRQAARGARICETSLLHELLFIRSNGLSSPKAMGPWMTHQHFSCCCLLNEETSIFVFDGDRLLSILFLTIQGSESHIVHIQRCELDDDWCARRWRMAPGDIAKHVCRADSRFAPSQWETALLCNDVSHWLGASLESALWMWCQGWSVSTELSPDGMITVSEKQRQKYAFVYKYG